MENKYQYPFQAYNLVLKSRFIKISISKNIVTFAKVGCTPYIWMRTCVLGLNESRLTIRGGDGSEPYDRCGSLKKACHTVIA